MPGDEDATMVVSAPRAAAARAVAEPAVVRAAPAVAGKKGGAPVGLIAGGVAAVVVVGGAVAWFALRSPAPVAVPAAVAPVAVAPVAPVVQAAADPAAVSAALAAATANIACSYVDSSVAANAVSLGGIAGNGDPLDAVTKAAAGAALPVAVSVKGFPSTYCAAVDLLRPVMLVSKLDFTVPEASGTVNSSEMVHPTVSNLPFTGWLEVDYLSGDGTVAHLFPTAADRAIGFVADSARLLTMGSDLRLGDSPHNGLEPGPPYGTDMVVAIESSEKLFPAPRAQGESMAGYVAALQAALARVKADGGRMAGGVVVLSTSEK